MSEEETELSGWVPYDEAPTTYHIPPDAAPKPGANKVIFPIQPSDRRRAEREILQCADILCLARVKWKGLSVPHLFTGDIEWDGQLPALVWDTETGSVREMHFSVKTDAFSIRGVIGYLEDRPERYVLDYDNGKYRYSVVAKRDMRGNFCLDRTGRMATEHRRSDRRRQIVAVVCASVCVVGVLGALISAFVGGERKLGTSDSDTVPVYAEQTSQRQDAELILLYLTDPVQAGGNLEITVKGQPDTEYQVASSAYGSELPKGTSPTRSDAQGMVSFSFSLPKRLEAGTYTVTVFDRVSASTFSFTVEAKS